MIGAQGGSSKKRRRGLPEEQGRVQSKLEIFISKFPGLSKARIVRPKFDDMGVGKRKVDEMESESQAKQIRVESGCDTR